MVTRRGSVSPLCDAIVACWIIGEKFSQADLHRNHYPLTAPFAGPPAHNPRLATSERTPDPVPVPPAAIQYHVVKLNSPDS